MAAKKIKLCIGCTCLFQGRRDAKTCSDKCRKRVQRAKADFEMQSLWNERRPLKTLAGVKHG